MARSPEPPSPLVLAAQELEDELRRCEKAVDEAAHWKLNSEKNLGRAAQALKSANEDREAMGARVQALLTAIQDANGRMQAAAGRMATRASELQARMAALETHQAATLELGAAAREVADLAQQGPDPRRVLERLVPLEERAGKAFENARADGFDDVARELAAMRDMLGSLRKKLAALP